METNQKERLQQSYSTGNTEPFLYSVPAPTAFLKSNAIDVLSSVIAVATATLQYYGQIIMTPENRPHLAAYKRIRKICLKLKEASHKVNHTIPTEGRTLIHVHSGPVCSP